MFEFAYNMTAEGGVTSAAQPPNHSSRQRAIMAKRQVSGNAGDSQSEKTEIWKPVPSERGVLASSWGRILQPPRHAPLPNGGYRIYTPRPVIGQRMRASKGASHVYMGTLIRADGDKQRPRKVHQMVCEAFHGPRPFPTAVVIHLDEDATNNRPENLKWGTQKENLNMPKIKAYHKSRTGDLHPSVRYSDGRMSDIVNGRVRA